MLSIDLNIIVEIHEEEILSTAAPVWQSKIPDITGYPQETAWGNLCPSSSPSLHYDPDDSSPNHSLDPEM